jgi:type IV secretion system protein VirB8
MSDLQRAFPLSAPALEKHYKEVATFQEARARAARLLSKGLIVGIVLSMLANLGLAWAVASMLPLTRLVPVYMLIRPDGTIDNSVSLSSLPPSMDQAVIRAALWEYVQMREGYSYDTARYRYDIVSGMSDSNTRTSYQQYFNYPNPQSPQVTIGKNQCRPDDDVDGDNPISTSRHATSFRTLGGPRGDHHHKLSV